MMHWISSSRMRANIRYALKLIFDALRPLYPALPEPGDIAIPAVEANRRHGDDERWRHVLPGDLRRLMWDTLGEPIADRFRYCPA
jgi:hypothetical protein